MQLKFSALLACVLVALSTDALPHPKRNPGTVTLPLRRVEQRSDAHPQIVHQQNINRSHRRLARMTGRSEPTTEELSNNLRKRILAVEGTEGLERRYNRLGVPSSKGKAKAKTAGSGASLASTATKNGNGPFQGITKSKSNANGNAQGNTQGNVKGNTNGNAQGNTQGNANGNVKGNTNGNTKGNTKGNTGTGAGNGKPATGAGGGVAAIPIPAGVTVADDPATANSLGLDIEANDIGYLATVQMGTPPRDFLILMDSGSADLWVGAENCQSDAGGGCGNHNFLGPQSSSTFQDSKAPFTVTYGTGQVSGSIIQDDITVAGLTLKAHKFGVATTESVDFSDDSTPFDGLMGLAQATLSQQQTATPIEALAADGQVKAPITSYKIPRLADNKNDGEITFGGLDNTKFNAKTLVALDNVSQQGFWEANMDAVTVDGADVGLQGRTAILDTGTTLIIAPPDDAAAVHKNIQGAKSDGQGGFTVPCTTKAKVALSFGGTSFAIDPRDIAFQPVDPADPTGDCVSGIAAGNIGGATEWLVGDVFLKNAYFSTDVAQNTLSLAKLV